MKKASVKKTAQVAIEGKCDGDGNGAPISKAGSDEVAAPAVEWVMPVKVADVAPVAVNPDAQPAVFNFDDGFADGPEARGAAQEAEVARRIDAALNDGRAAGLAEGRRLAAASVESPTPPKKKDGGDDSLPAPVAAARAPAASTPSDDDGGMWRVIGALALIVALVGLIYYNWPKDGHVVGGPPPAPTAVAKPAPATVPATPAPVPASAPAPSPASVEEELVLEHLEVDPDTGSIKKVLETKRGSTIVSTAETIVFAPSYAP